MVWAADRSGEAVEPFACLDILLRLAGVSDIACDEDAVGGPRRQGRHNRSRVGDELPLYAIVYVDDMVSLLTEMDVGDVDEDYRHQFLDPHPTWSQRP